MKEEKLSIIAELKKNDISFYCLLVTLVVSIGGGFVFSFTTQVICFVLLSLSFSFVFVKKSFEPKSALIVFLPLAAAAVSYIGADFQANVRISLLALLNATIAFFAALYADERNRENMLITLTVLGVWVSGMMFASIASGHSDPEKSFSLNVNIVAGFLLLVYPLNFGFAERGKKTKVFLIAAFVMFAAIMATKSRSAIALAYIVTIFYFVRLKKDAALKIFAAAATAIFLAGLIYAVRSKIGWASLSDRLMWWKTCLIMFKANHFFGVGFGNFSALYLFYRPELTLNTIFAHNIVLQLLAETGIFGFAAFAAAASSIAKNIFSRIKSGPYIMAAFVSTAAFICLNLTDYSFFIPANMLVFYVIVGTAFTAVISKRKKLFPALAVFIPALYLIYVFAASVNAQSYYEEGNFLFNEGKYEQAAQKYEKATQNDEINPVYRHSLSESMYSLCAAEPDSEKRKLYLQTAVDSDLKAEQYYRSSAEIKAELAFLYKFSGDDAKAAEYMELARKCDKFNPRLRAGEKKNE